jgi:hypothetical protein
MKIFQLIVLGIALSTASFLSKASLIINVNETLGDVIFDVSGSLDMTDAIFINTGTQRNGLISGGSNWYIGTGDITSNNLWMLESVDIPFGTSTSFNTSYSQATGDTFGIWGNSGGTPRLILEQGYLSGAFINSLLTYSGETFSSLGLTSGVYRFDIPSDYVELRIGQARVSVPEPISLVLLGLGVAGICFSRKNKSA